MTQSEDDVGVPSGASGWGALSQSLYHDLRQRARELMVGERIDHTLQPTALVHEALGRLLSGCWAINACVASYLDKRRADRRR